jgi:hypothetical protein
MYIGIVCICKGETMGGGSGGREGQLAQTHVQGHIDLSQEILKQK